MTESTITPAEFDVEAWLTDAKMPEESAEVYKRADVVAELQVVKRQIETQREAATIEKTAHGNTVLRNLETRYKDLVETFCASKLTIYVRAISPDEQRESREITEKRTEGMEPKLQNLEFGYDLLARSIVAVRPAEGERTEVNWSMKQVKAMEKSIGAAQMSEVLNARMQAQNGLPRVDADFLLKPSGSDDGQG
jgi:hypothetical protein